jgi:hypothetical protein
LLLVVVVEVELLHLALPQVMGVAAVRVAIENF